MNLEDVKKAVDEGHAAAEARIASLKKEQEAEIKRLNDALTERDQKFQAQEKWIKDVEAQVNTARTHGTGDQLKNAIPEHLRGQIEIAEAMGYKDPVRKVGTAVWTQAHIMRQLAAMQGNPIEKWVQQRDAIEKAWGFDREAYTKTVIKAAMGEVAGGGANIIATPVEAELLRLIRDNTVIRPLASKIVMTSLTHQLPTENANLTAWVISEVGLVSDAYGTNTTGFSQIALTARKFGAIARISNELLADNIVALQEYLFTGIGEAIGILEDQAATDSSAAGVAFTGILVATGVNSFSLAANTSGGSIPTYPDITKAVFLARQAASRSNAYFIMQTGIFGAIAGITDTNGQPVVQYSNVPNAIAERLCGYPVALSSAITRTNAAASGSYHFYFGPPSKIVFGDLSGMELFIDPYSLSTTYETRIRVIKRTGIVVPVGSYFTIAKGVTLTL